MRRDVFQAIADPTRREIIDLVAFQSLNLNSIAEKFDVSRPAISQHIKLLSECGLIVIRKQGRERYCEARLQQLNEVSHWIERYRKLWAGRYEALDDLLEEIAFRAPACTEPATRAREIVFSFHQAQPVFRWLGPILKKRGTGSKRPLRPRR